jgi:N-acetylmuramic acid 6-phosphate etherase
MGKRLYDHLQTLTTEARNPHSAHLDRLNTAEILRLINREDQKVAQGVKKVLPQVAKAVEMVTASFKSGGRLIYVGAGTSGRLGVLDAAECPPTFGVSPRMVQGVIAGGRQTLIKSREGVEDDVKAAVRDIEKAGPTPKDTVIGIAASGRTPYPLAALKLAKNRKAKTVFLVCNDLPSLPPNVDLVINPVLGSEVLTGSTRMKAGTACKLILNMITTASMVRIGKCYGNLMVDLRATSAKLVERSKSILAETTSVSYRDAERLLKQAHGEVKTAIVMQLLAVDYQTARSMLARNHGQLHRLLKSPRQ